MKTPLHSPIFNTDKVLPSNLKIRIGLTRADDDFVLLAPPDSNYSIFLEEVHLECTFVQPADKVERELEVEIKRNPVSYTFSKPTIILKPINQYSKVLRINDIFHANSVLPSFAFMALQRSIHYEGTKVSNPFIFVPFEGFNMYINGRPMFQTPLEVRYVDEDGVYGDVGDFYRQLLHTVGKDRKGSCLITSKNFQLNFMAALNFTADRSSVSAKHLNLQRKASTACEIDLGAIYDKNYGDLILIIWAFYNSQITIDAEGKVQVIEA